MDRDQERELYSQLNLDITSAYSDEPEAVCGGGLPIAGCETSQAMFQAAKENISGQKAEPRRAAEGEAWTVLAWLGKNCANCAKVCDVSIKSVDGYTTGLSRVRYIERDPTIPVININSASLVKNALSPEEMEDFRQAVESIRQHITVSAEAESDENSESTAEQANELLRLIESLSADPPNPATYGTHGLGKKDLAAIPKEVATHMPDIDVLSKGTDLSVYVIREYNPRTGQPRQHGVLAMVSFTQKELVAEGLIYATHANYHIVQEKSGALSLERHMTATEHGMHKVRELYEQRARMQTVEGIEDFIEESREELRRLDEARPLEKETGISTVTKKEAQQIIDFCKNLKKEE